MGNRSILTGALALGLLMAAVPEGHADHALLRAGGRRV